MLSGERFRHCELVLPLILTNFKFLVLLLKGGPFSLSFSSLKPVEAPPPGISIECKCKCWPYFLYSELFIHLLFFSSIFLSFAGLSPLLCHPVLFSVFSLLLSHTPSFPPSLHSEEPRWLITCFNYIHLQRHFISHPAVSLERLSHTNTQKRKMRDPVESQKHTSRLSSRPPCCLTHTDTQQSADLDTPSFLLHAPIAEERNSSHTSPGARCA